MFLFFSCKTSQHTSPDNKDNTTRADELDSSDNTSTKNSSLLNTDCQFDDRKNVGEIINTVGKIILAVRVFIIEMEDGQRFYPCNLPVKYRKEGQTVVFSGNMKEIKPNERWGGKPFQITSIHSQTSSK